MPYVQSFDDTPLWYDVRGDGNSLPLLLIAGNGCDHTVWRHVTDDFASQRPVIVYDHRGTGQSGSHFPPGWSTRDFARDAFSVLQAAGVSRAHVYGHSMGGRVAQWLASDRPDVTEALILGATSVGDRRGVPRSDKATKAMMENDAESLQAMCYPQAWLRDRPEQAMDDAPAPHSLNAFLSHLRASGEHDSWDIAASIRSPVLVIHGTEDGITPAGNAEILASRIPGARLMMIEKARHVYWAGYPEAHLTVSAFMKEAESARGR